MDNFLFSYKLHRIFLSILLITFTMSIIPTQIYSNPHVGINFNEIAFAVRLEKFIEKINRYKEKKDLKKLVKLTFEIKREVEAYIGRKINITDEFDKIEQQIILNGGQLRDGELKDFRKTLRKKEKKEDRNTLYIQTLLQNDCFLENDLESFLIKKKHDEYICNEHEEQITIPLRVSVGVTIALCGLFLSFVPYPGCQYWGAQIMSGGIFLAIEGTINRIEEDEKKD